MLMTSLRQWNTISCTQFESSFCGKIFECNIFEDIDGSVREFSKDCAVFKNGQYEKIKITITPKKYFDEKVFRETKYSNAGKNISFTLKLFLTINTHIINISGDSLVF